MDRNAFHLIYYMLAEYLVLTLAINPPPFRWEEIIYDDEIGQEFDLNRATGEIHDTNNFQV
jgi:hypothetical protein